MNKQRYSFVINFILAGIIAILLFQNKIANQECVSADSKPDGSVRAGFVFQDTTYEKKSLGAYTMIYPQPVFVIGTYGVDQHPNMMAAAWAGIANSRPAMVSIGIAPERLTHENIIANQAFTLCVAPAEYVKEVDYVGSVSGREFNKFNETGLTPIRSKLVNAPYVKEYPLALECRVHKIIELGTHNLIIGEILDVKCDPDFIIGDDNPDITKINPITFAYGEQGYFRLGEYLGKAGTMHKDLIK